MPLPRHVKRTSSSPFHPRIWRIGIRPQDTAEDRYAERGLTRINLWRILYEPKLKSFEQRESFVVYSARVIHGRLWWTRVPTCFVYLHGMPCNYRIEFLEYANNAKRYSCWSEFYFIFEYIYIYIGFLFHHSLKNMQIRFKIYNIL